MTGDTARGSRPYLQASEFVRPAQFGTTAERYDPLTRSVSRSPTVAGARRRRTAQLPVSEREAAPWVALIWATPGRAPPFGL
jgi:hypothetical protein